MNIPQTVIDKVNQKPRDFAHVMKFVKIMTAIISQMALIHSKHWDRKIRLTIAAALCGIVAEIRQLLDSSEFFADLSSQEVGEEFDRLVADKEDD